MPGSDPQPGAGLARAAARRWPPTGPRPRRPHDRADRFGSTWALSHSHDGTAAPLPRRRRDPQPATPGPGPRGGADPLHEPPVAAERLLAGDLLLDDRRDERVEDQPAARHPPVRVAAPGVRDRRVVGAKPSRSSSSPSSRGRVSSAHSAPVPHARASTCPRAGRDRSSRVAGPVGAWNARTSPVGPSSLVGSPRPRRKVASIWPSATDRSLRQWRSSPVVVLAPLTGPVSPRPPTAQRAGDGSTWPTPRPDHIQRAGDGSRGRLPTRPPPACR